MSKIVDEILRKNGLTPSGAGNNGSGDGAGTGDEGNENGAGNNGSGDGAGTGDEGNENGAGNNGSGDGAGTGDEGNENGGGNNGSGDGAGTGDEDIADDVLVAQLRKRGIDVKDIKEIGKPAPAALTPEQEAELLQKRQDDMRRFALKNKIVTSTQFDDYVKETNIPPMDMAFLLYRKERLETLKAGNTAADQMPSDKDLRDEFDEAHFQFADPSDPKRIRAEKLLNKTVDDYINDKYAAIVSLDETYSAHEEERVQRTGYSTLIKTATAKIGEKLPLTIPIGGKDKEFTFDYKLLPDTLSKIEQNYLSDVSFNAFGKSGVKESAIVESMKAQIIASEFSKIMAQGMEAYASAKIAEIQKGRRGIPPLRDDDGSEGGTKKASKIVSGILQHPDNKKLLTPKKV